MTLTPEDIVPGTPLETFDARRRYRGVFTGTLSGTMRRSRSRPRVVVIACFIWLGFVVLLAIFANVLPIANPTVIVGNININPNLSHEFLGTDAIGRSMISRLVFGAQVSFLISLLVNLVAAVVGGGIGLLSTYFKGTVTFVADTIANTILSIPGLLLLLAIVVVFHPTIPVLVLAIAFLYLPGYMRVTRANALSQMQQEYIVAARGLGASPRRIILGELLPNTALALVTFGALTVPGAMLIEGSLSYLGFGVQLPTPSWGSMIAQGQQSLTFAPWQAIIPCIVFAVTVFTLYTVGDWLRAKLDVRGGASQ
jgi:peptide/nickel transport system permease protein